VVIATRRSGRLTSAFDVELPWGVEDIKSRPCADGVRGLLGGGGDLSGLGFGDAEAAEVAREVAQAASGLTALSLAGGVSASCL
jgi:hypothetical protein